MNIGEAVRLRIIELCRNNNITVNKLSTLCAYIIYFDAVNKLSTLSGITQSTLNNIVSGRNNSTTVSTVKKICDGLELNIIDFFTSPLFENLEQEIK